MISVDIALRLAGVTVLALIAVLWMRDARPKLTGIMIALFCFGIASYLLCPPMDRLWQLGIFEIPFFIGCFSAAVFFYLMSRAIFDDRFRLRPWHFSLLVVMMMLGGWHRYGASLPPDTDNLLGTPQVPLVIHQILSLIITASALIQARLEKAGDLVEARRQFRDIFVGVSGIYILIVLAVEIFLRDQAAHPVLETINVAAILILSFVFAATMTRLKPVFEPLPRNRETASAVSPPYPELESLEASLKQSMQERFIYRREGLSIAKLATELGTQEYLLRRLINGKMGYRNFNEFLNAYRIAEVQKQLASLDFAKLPILTIAMDCGYSSLGPFNRAFKEIAGMTPKQYRAERLAVKKPQK